MKTNRLTRRQFVKQSGLIAGSSISMITASSFANIITPPNDQKVGVALVGLGYYSSRLLAPALQMTKHCELRGIVTGSPEKIPVWQDKYGIKDRNVYNYENMHQVADNDDIDVIYIVLPNNMHNPYSIIAAEAGKHVWCEKPFALTEKECQEIIDVCRKNNVKLTVGYRMQHEPNTQTIIGWATKKPYGKINLIQADAGFRDSRQDHWRLKKDMGGGAMFDMGVYSLNGARYTTGEEPIAVTARYETERPEIYNEVDETTYFVLEFPGGAVANCATSFAKNLNHLKVNCENGWYELKPFQSYSGISGATSDGKSFSDKIPNQQARQMDNDALAILNDTDVIVPGEEGLRDIRVVEAIFKSAEEGIRVEL